MRTEFDTPAYFEAEGGNSELRNTFDPYAGEQSMPTIIEEVRVLNQLIGFNKGH